MEASERHHGWAYEHSRWAGCVVHMAKLTEMPWKAVPRAKRSWRACACKGEGEWERELYDYFRQFHWPTKQSWADELALFNFNWSQLAETLISNGTMLYNPMSSTLSLNPYCFLSKCIGGVSHVLHYNAKTVFRRTIHLDISLMQRQIQRQMSRCYEVMKEEQ